MNLSREIRATLFTAVGLAFALSVVQGWGWPWLSDARAGIIALGIAGFAACTTSNANATTFSIKDPYVIAAVAVGIVVLAAGVIGLFANTLQYLVVMMVATAALWLIATTRHLVVGGAKPIAAPTA
jgi:hypothetical protein